jgi:hypothetical protein
LTEKKNWILTKKAQLDFDKKRKKKRKRGTPYSRQTHGKPNRTIPIAVGFA